MLKALRDRRGIASIEYGILAVLIIAAVATAMAAFTPALTEFYTGLGNLLTARL